MKTFLAVIALVVAPLVASASAYSDAVTGEGTLIYYWKLDEAAGTTCAPTVGAVNMYCNGTGNQAGMSGSVGTSFYFDGSGAGSFGTGMYMTSADNLSAYSRLTVEFLAKYDTYTGADTVGAELGTGGYGNGEFTYTVDNSGGLIGTQLVCTSGNVGIDCNQYTAISANTWHHIVLDFDFTQAAGSEPSYWVDGVELTPASHILSANNTGTFSASAALNMMARNNTSLYRAKGYMQHIAVYSGLSAARIAAHYAAINPVVVYPYITYSFARADLWDNGYNNTSDDPRQSILSRVRFRTNSTYVTLSATQELFPYYPDYTEIVAKVDGVALSPYQITPDAGTFTIQLSDAGTLRTVELIGSTQYAWAGINGTFIDTVTYRDGGVFTVQAQPAAQSRTVFYGDSIAAGFGADVPATESYVAVLRNMGFSAMGESYGGRTLALDADTSPHRAAFVAKMASFSPSTIWLAIGVNDWGVPAWSAANFGVAYAATVDDLHTSMPTARIVCQTPILRSVETANVHGDTLGAYRTQIATVCGARPWTTLVDGTAILALGDLTDGTHPSTAGHAKYAAYIAGVLAPRKNPPRVGGRRGITIKN